jgi:hypothetical protein
VVANYRFSFGFKTNRGHHSRVHMISWIYNYLCNQCLSPLMLWDRIPLMVRPTRYNIMWLSLSVVISRYSGFLHQQNLLPWYNWNIVESGVKHHNPNLGMLTRNKNSIFMTEFIQWNLSKPNLPCNQLLCLEYRGCSIYNQDFLYWCLIYLKYNVEFHFFSRLQFSQVSLYVIKTSLFHNILFFFLHVIPLQVRLKLYILCVGYEIQEMGYTCSVLLSTIFRNVF